MILSTARRWTSQSISFIDLPMICLIAFGLLLTTGCGNSQSDTLEAGVGIQEDPEGDFAWGVERLERALRLFSPKSSQGLHVTERKLEHDLFPPSKDNPNYSAKITITTETAFLHAKRSTPKKEKPEDQADKGLEIDDPLDEDSDEEFELPDIDSKVVPAAPVNIETRSLDHETVFEMIYTDGKWKLTKKPELDYEKSWFEYAFE